jgi:hypothetical protein
MGTRGVERLSMERAIFLSAGVPDPRRGPEYAATADTVAITAAVSALVYVTLGRRLLVWGGQPAITPMIWVVAKDMGLEYGKWVRLYQSRYFEDEFPEDNSRFDNVTYVDNVENDHEKSLLLMRRRMFSDYTFDFAVFIGGMKGIIDEFALFQQLQPSATVVPVISTGGAALNLELLLRNCSKDLSNDFDFVGLFHRHLNISARERRYSRPEDQPREVELRYWRPPDAAI